MGCLDELETRLKIQPFEFKKDEELPSPSLNETTSKNEYEIDKDLLNIEEDILRTVAIGWYVPTNTVINLYNHIKSIYKNQSTNSRITDLCETILYGICNNNISKAYVNDLIKELNSLV